MNYREIDGVRFLETYIWTSFNRRENKETLSSTTTAAFGDDWRFNVAIPTERFDLVFPDSVDVILRRMGGTFVPKKTGSNSKIRSNNSITTRHERFLEIITVPWIKMRQLSESLTPVING